jgi:lipid-A-disaccharide synthase-like uncharacterized protein
MQLSFIDLLIYALGFLAQMLFFTRSFIQWFSSEKAGKVLSPLLFWQISLVASILMMVYGILRKDPAIITGQFTTFYIYIRNLQIQGEWKKIPKLFRYPVSIMPLVCLGWIIFSGNNGWQQIIGNEKIAEWLMIFGVMAQVTFTFRFVYQWIVAEKNQKSILPVGFWYFSLIGGLMTLFYATMRLDPVLLLSNGMGIFMYSRNLIVHYTGKGLFELLPFNIVSIKNPKKKH